MNAALHFSDTGTQAPATKVEFTDRSHATATARGPGTVILAGGGTGGHVLPALALADAFVARLGVRVVFIGTAKGLEATLVPKRGYPFEVVQGTRLVGGGARQKFEGLRSLISGVREARALLRQHGADLVVGVGGYASGAALLAARSLGIPTAIHESNAVAGFTNKVLGHLVDRVYLGFAAAEADFARDVTVLSGNPVRAAITAVGAHRLAPAQSHGLAGSWAHAVRPARVLVVGGSQGSQFLNSQVPDLLARVQALGIALEVRHQVGRQPPEPVAERYASLGLAATVETFIDDMAAAYAWADTAVTRSGSGTVAELAAAALPALLVPFPHAAGDHQTANARAFAAAGAGTWVREAAWNEAALARVMADLLRDRPSWLAAAKAAWVLGNRDAAGAVVDDCARWMEGRW